MHITFSVLLHQSDVSQPPPPGEEEEEEADEGLAVPGCHAPPLHSGEGGDEEKKPQHGSGTPGCRCGGQAPLCQLYEPPVSL